MQPVAPGLNPLPSLPDAQAPAPTPPGRTSVNGKLVSLAVPTPGREELDFHSVLLSCIAYIPVNGPAPTVASNNVTAAVWALDEQDIAPPLALAQACMDLLLTLGQTKLMAHLVQKCPQVYTMRIDTPTACETLAKVGPAWPKDAPIGLNVLNTLAAPAAPFLHEIMATYDTCCLKTSAYEVPDPLALEALAGALRPRHWPSLSVSVGAHPLETFRALKGFSCEELVIIEVPDAGSGLTDWEALAPVAVDLVTHSAARRLVVVGEDIPAAFTARLVAARTSWESIRVPYTPAQAPLPPIESRIHRLQLDVGQNVLSSPAGFMHMLQAMHVRELVIEGFFDLTGFAQSLALASPGGLSLTLLDSSFLLSAGSDYQATLAALAHDVCVEKTVHRQIPSAPPPGYAPPTAPQLELLEAQNVANQAALLRRMQPEASAKTAAWLTAVTAVSEVLAPNRTIRSMIQYLLDCKNTIVDLRDLSWMPAQADHSLLLADKLKSLQACGFPNALIVQAIQMRLQEHPAEATELCQALILARFPVQPVSSSAWTRLADQHRREWMRANQGAAFEDRVLPLAPASPVKTTTTATTSTTTTNIASTGAASTTAKTLTPTAEAVAVGTRANGALSAERRQALHPWVAEIAQRAGPMGAVLSRVLLALLDRGQVDPDLERLDVSHEISAALLEAGELALLRYIATLTREVFIHATDAERIAPLARMAALPYEGGHYVLALNSDLPRNELVQVFTMARSVPAEQLTLIFIAKFGTTDDVWPAWADFLRSHPGTHLRLALPEHSTLLQTRMIRLLDAIRPDSLRGFGLEGDLQQVDPRFAQALLKSVHRSGARELSLGDEIDTQTAGLLLKLQPWAKLEMDLTEAYNVHFESRTVSTKFLKIRSLTSTIEHAASCPGLETLEMDHTHPVPFLALAQLLHRWPGIRSVKTPLVFTDEAQFQEGLNLLMQRPPLNLEITGQLDAPFARRIQEAMLRRRLRDPALASEGAGKALGYGLGALLGKPLGAGELVDVGGRLTKRLDTASARALAQTSRATYAAWKHAWTVEVDRIGAWLSPSVAYETFRERLLERVNGDSPFNNLAGPLVDTYPEQPTLSKAIALQLAGMPLDVITMAISLQLGDDAFDRPALLEALAYFGVVKPEEWLKEAYGINVPSPTRQA